MNGFTSTTDGSLQGTDEIGAGYYKRDFEGHTAVIAPLSNYNLEIAAVQVLLRN